MIVSDSEKTVDMPDSGVARLDYFVRRRTSTLRISNYELARRGGPNRTTLHKAVNGTGRLRESTLARIDARQLALPTALQEAIRPIVAWVASEERRRNQAEKMERMRPALEHGLRPGR